MENELQAEGKCIYCSKTFSQKKIVTHLKEHLSMLERQSSATETVYHLNIEAGEMFLQVLVKGNATFKTLDTYLRNIWVECCGHLSSFYHKNLKISMSQKFQDALAPKLKFMYDYDFGDTTTLSLQVAGEYHTAIKENVFLLSRNEPLKIMCRVCKKKPAIAICTTHMYETDEYFFCEGCAKKHEKECEDFSDYANMPVVNSPRMGVCGYTGGHIDKARDGVYKI
jgi:hypothetical protein